MLLQIFQLFYFNFHISKIGLIQTYLRSSFFILCTFSIKPIKNSWYCKFYNRIQNHPLSKNACIKFLIYLFFYHTELTTKDETAETIKQNLYSVAKRGGAILLCPPRRALPIGPPRHTCPPKNSFIFIILDFVTNFFQIISLQVNKEKLLIVILFVSLLMLIHAVWKLGRNKKWNWSSSPLYWYHTTKNVQKIYGFKIGKFLLLDGIK